MPNFDKNELPHGADPMDYDRRAALERLPDRPGDGTHIHSLDRCDHYIAGGEVGWLCGKFPMFTNVATSRAVGDVITVDGDGNPIAFDRACAHLSASGVDQTEGPDKVWRCDACGWRYYSRRDEDGFDRMIPAPVR